MDYKPTIGLEIHIELQTNSKMFCSCPNDPDEKRPNFNVCPICMGHPGTLPVINKEAVRKTIKTGIALNCKVADSSRFNRKNYFYPDLPKGYQISQYELPICNGGFLEVNGRKIRIRRIHLEEDTGKLIHPEGKNYSLVDFNRAGIPLMELVTEPDLKSAQETKKFAEELHIILHYLNVSDADMEKGQMRVEANISLAPYRPALSEKGGAGAGFSKDQKLGTKVEIKNLNSFRSVERALEYEIKRQSELLGGGEKIIQETRGWDENKEVTVSQREKEEAHDYRYFPEPDLLPFYFNQNFINEIRAEIPELPEAKKERFKEEYGLDEKNIDIFVYNKDLSEYFEQVVSEFEPGLSEERLASQINLAKNYIISDLQGLLGGVSVASKDFLITPENFAELIALIFEGKISSKIAKQVLEEMFRTGADPSNIIEEKGLSQVTDETEIERIVKDVIEKNQKVVADYKKGKEASIQFLVGQVMAATKGKASPEIVNRLLKEVLDKI
ncbi:MAG: Asp-tRNA(Asn)/Glu-tRNA(Gln) amidotransferase subunit GatB [Candidatus Staskawiczbacteria bacterium CG10_big_fil_rev_8_21_14_0_10_38_10]|uniref:Aspartyl/glutamyl-tRNA(Asn/Gln) amidotransferase subunit B n=1 Tax=Candidatus Staskawiczbacteria bacterium CG10_big_fil_rev_8_21_14_0_10_38_10 TaxID=1974891 RepID=A0A2H9T0X4_9BACT|nr:MAG: Asp-tRNA(Asn)/Glu-tRNA(Gln) amidotransferase subunit GatB [Candidatus Staskawiczbacteria bacterium CG10_big_fil_rev_8_21_14_0_10_38_10]